ncbi:MAG: DUF2809 domain-containing protein [Clostridium sp.]|nr:DUF2809 domain-containing protein [Clostridium sp.]
MYTAAFLLLLLIEIMIGIYVHDAFIRPYLGDVLVVLLIYFFVRIFIPDGIKQMPFYIFLFAVAVELLQYFQLAGRLGIGRHTLLGIILGSVFDIKDIVCYSVGCALIMTAEKIKGGRRQAS